MKILKRVALEAMFYSMLGLMMLGLITMGTMSGALGFLISLSGSTVALWASMELEDIDHEC